MEEFLAEREGFEPPIPFRVCPLSRRIVSTTHAPLRAKKRVLDYAHYIRTILIISGLAPRWSRYPLRTEEVSQYLSALFLQHSARDLHLMIQPGMI